MRNRRSVISPANFLLFFFNSRNDQSDELLLDNIRMLFVTCEDSRQNKPRGLIKSASIKTLMDVYSNGSARNQDPHFLFTHPDKARGTSRLDLSHHGRPACRAFSVSCAGAVNTHCGVSVCSVYPLVELYLLMYFFVCSHVELVMGVYFSFFCSFSVVWFVIVDHCMN